MSQPVRNAKFEGSAADNYERYFVPAIGAPLAAALADALARHINTEVASFVHLVFALHDPDELRELLDAAGFRDLDVRRATKVLHVPPAGPFMWQYIHSTPTAGVLADLDDQPRTALERDVCTRWEPYAADGGMRLEVGMTTVIGRR
ncbi:MAG TPA: hypothetical protein VE175_05490 [Woeseiaceae bacterium]|jgi:hypothetical protein|nr:hypothetical protein [Woeseiaceae bacterium]